MFDEASSLIGRLFRVLLASALLLAACASDDELQIAATPEQAEVDVQETGVPDEQDPMISVPLLTTPIALSVGETVDTPVKLDPADLIRQTDERSGRILFVIRERSMTDNSFSVEFSLVTPTTGTTVVLDDLILFDQRSAFENADALIRSQGELGYFLVDVTDQIREIAAMELGDWLLRVKASAIHADEEESALTFLVNDVSLVVAEKP